ncbi:MAG: hypothetical protein JST39_06425 [Bacteroidetes bacterium]|nr:hypothetical protein [Bacteroidota bacterium]
MSIWLFCIPLACGALGWVIHRLALLLVFAPVEPRSFLGLRIQGLLPRRREALIAQIADAAAAFMPDAAALETIIANPAHFQKIMPVVEEQIDHFLRVKLKQSMPVVGMFIGDKTIGQLKAVFVTELEQIFPSVMKNYAAGLAGEFDVKRLITQKLSAMPAGTLVEQVKNGLRQEMVALQRLGFFSGLCTGALALLLAWWTSH